MGVELDGRWLHASDYPRHVVEHSQVQGYLGEATAWQVSYSGLSGQPDLVYHLRAYSREPFGDIQVTVRNTTGKEIHLESIRCLDATEGPIIDLGGPVLEDRVLSDSFSEDRPAITIRNFADAEQQMHRAVGSQLIYNRQSHESLFLGALSSDRFFTILRLHLANSGGNGPRPAAYEVDSTGTTEINEGQFSPSFPAGGSGAVKSASRPRCRAILRACTLQPGHGLSSAAGNLWFVDRSDSSCQNFGTRINGVVELDGILLRIK